MRFGSTLAAALWCACATTAGQQERPLVRSLEIEGTAQLPVSRIQERILTAESSRLPGWVPFFGDVHTFDPSVWQADLRRIERVYQANGYYQARIIEESVDESTPGIVRLKVKIEEGEPTRIRAVRFDGLEALAEKERSELWAEVPLKAGEVFLEDKWVGLKSRLEARLREWGYAQALVEGEVAVDVEKLEAAISLLARVGPRYRFGNIFVTNNEKVPTRYLKEVVETEVKPGRQYSESALADAQARVFQMGMFGAVKVNRGAPNVKTGDVPVVVDVREAPFHSLRVGGGLGLDRNRQDIRVVGEFTNRNFFGSLRRYTLRGNVGYAFLPNVWTVAQGINGSQQGISFRVTNELEQPRFYHPTLSQTTALELSRTIEPAYNFIGGNLRLGMAWQPNPGFRIKPTYNLDLYLLSSDVPFDGRSPDVAFGCPTTCVLSYLEQIIEWDRRDDPLDPRNGHYLGLLLQEGGGPLQGAFTFFRVQPDLRVYRSFGKRGRFTLAGKLKLGTVWAPEGRSTPIVSRFFSGGGVAMRGFNTRRLSPLLTVQRGGKDTPDNPDDDTYDTVPIGGNGLFESSVELRYNVTGDFVLATFLDSGFVTQGALTSSGFGQNLLYAVGLGFRYRTPLGPLRLDLAHRLPYGPALPISSSGATPIDVPVDRSCFGLGNYGGNAGSPEGLCSLHLSIGEAF